MHEGGEAPTSLFRIDSPAYVQSKDHGQGSAQKWLHGWYHQAGRIEHSGNPIGVEIVHSIRPSGVSSSESGWGQLPHP